MQCGPRRNFGNGNNSSRKPFEGWFGSQSVYSSDRQALSFPCISYLAPLTEDFLSPACHCSPMSARSINQAWQVCNMLCQNATCLDSLCPLWGKSQMQTSLIRSIRFNCVMLPYMFTHDYNAQLTVKLLHTHATYVDVRTLWYCGETVCYISGEKEKVSASVPGSHCYATQQLDIQVNRSSTTVGGRKNAKPRRLSSGDTFKTSEKQTRGLWEVNIVERVQCVKPGGIAAAGSVRYEWYVGREVQFGGRARAEIATFGSATLQEPKQMWGAVVAACAVCIQSTNEVQVYLAVLSV